MYAFLILIHVLVCIGLILGILLQSGSGGGLAGAFGGGGISSAVFGGRGAAPFLVKLSTILAVVFALSCISQSVIHPSKHATSIIQEQAKQRAKQPPPPQQQPPPTSQGEEGQFKLPAPPGSTGTK